MFWAASNELWLWSTPYLQIVVCRSAREIIHAGKNAKDEANEVPCYHGDEMLGGGKFLLTEKKSIWDGKIGSY